MLFFKIYVNKQNPDEKNFDDKKSINCEIKNCDGLQ
jgi:hypothetical protein